MYEYVHIHICMYEIILVCDVAVRVGAGCRFSDELIGVLPAQTTVPCTRDQTMTQINN